jgi:transketolase
MDISKKNELMEISRRVRIGVVEAVYNAKAGHPGGSLSIVDTLVYLYFSKMNIDPKNPSMPDRDRLVLSKGHAAPGLYSVLANRGYFPVDDLKTLRKQGSHLQGHPCLGKTPGVDMSTGSLGQGFGAACGMALSLKKQASPSTVYAILGDGELQEGIVWEAAMFAAHYKLANLCAVVDNNDLQIDGRVGDVMSPYPIDEKFAAFGWNVIKADAHDFDSLEVAFVAADKVSKENGKPSVIVQKSVKGKGVSFMEDKSSWHGKAPNEEEYKQAMKELGGV